MPMIKYDSKNCRKIVFLISPVVHMILFIKFCPLMQNNRERPFWHFLQISSYSFFCFFAQWCELAIFKIWRSAIFVEIFYFGRKWRKSSFLQLFMGLYLYVVFSLKTFFIAISIIFLKSPEQPITAGFLEFMFVLKSFIHDLLFHSFVCSFVRLFLFQAPFH